VIAIFGFWTYQREWQGYVNGIIGLWLILSSFVPALTDQVNLTLSGIVVVALAIWRMVHIYSQWHWPTAVKGGKPMKSDVIQQPESSLEYGAPPEHTVAAASNLIIWILALSPIVGIFFELTGFVLLGLPVPILPDIAVIALSIYFGYLDQKKLKAIGHDTSKMGPPWLVPIYLFKRARILKHKLSYLIVWCGLCGVLVLL
jgi:hypothetical protein